MFLSLYRAVLVNTVCVYEARRGLVSNQSIRAVRGQCNNVVRAPCDAKTDMCMGFSATPMALLWIAGGPNYVHSLSWSQSCSRATARGSICALRVKTHMDAKNLTGLVIWCDRYQCVWLLSLGFLFDYQMYQINVCLAKRCWLYARWLVNDSHYDIGIGNDLRHINYYVPNTPTAYIYFVSIGRLIVQFRQIAIAHFHNCVSYMNNNGNYLLNAFLKNDTRPS